MRGLLRWIYRSRVLTPLREKIERGEEAAAAAAAAAAVPTAAVKALGTRLAALEQKTQALEQRLASMTGPRFDVRVFDHALSQARANYEPLAGTRAEYRALLDALVELDERLDVVPVYELARATSSPRPRVALRHDVDADPVTAVALARECARRGLPATFYLLPTAPYYGTVAETGEFIRNPALAGWVRALIVAGMEIGLHNDALGAHARTGDGPGFMVEELAWLRGQGAVVRGTAAHNSAPAYGAANSEVFRTRRLATPGTSEDGGPWPLESLDESALGLEYEGTFAVAPARVDTEAATSFCRQRAGASVHSEAWMRAFLHANPTCDWDLDAQAWMIGPDQWVVSETSGRFGWHEGFAAVRDWLAEAPEGARYLLVLHPEYFLNRSERT